MKMNVKAAITTGTLLIVTATYSMAQSKVGESVARLLAKDVGTKQMAYDSLTQERRDRIAEVLSLIHI